MNLHRPIKNIFLLIPIVALSIVTVTAQEHTLDLRISPVKSAHGTMMIALYDSEQTFLGDNYVHVYKEPVTKTGEVSFSIQIPKTGTYALSIFHDVNGNGTLEKNLFGIPIEPYGFSNDAPARFGPPKYADAKFEVRSGMVMRVGLR